MISLLALVCESLGYGPKPEFVKALGLSGRGGTGKGLPDYIMSSKKKTASAPSTPKARPTRVTGGGAAAAAAANDVDDDLEEIVASMGQSVSLGEGLQCQHVAPFFILVVDETEDPYFPEAGALDRMHVLITLGPGMKWEDVHFAIVENGSVILVRYKISPEMRDPKYLLGPQHYEDRVFGRALGKLLKDMPKEVAKKIRTPFPIETRFRYPDANMLYTTANNCLRRWKTSLQRGASGLAYQADVGRVCCLSLPKNNDDDRQRRKMTYEVEDYSNIVTSPPTPMSHAPRHNSSRGPARNLNQTRYRYPTSGNEAPTPKKSKSKKKKSVRNAFKNASKPEYRDMSHVSREEEKRRNDDAFRYQTRGTTNAAAAGGRTVHFEHTNPEPVLPKTRLKDPPKQPAPVYIPGQPKSTEEQKEAAKKANDDAWWDRVTRDGGGTVPPVFSVEDASESVSMQDAEVVAPTNSERTESFCWRQPACNAQETWRST